MGMEAGLGLHTQRTSGITLTLLQAGTIHAVIPCRGTPPPASAPVQRFDRAWLRPVPSPVPNNSNTP